MSANSKAVNDVARQRAWAADTTPGALVVDVHSTIFEMVGKAKQGAGCGYAHKLGFHPLLAAIAETGEILHGRLRKGSANTQRGRKRFVNRLVARLVARDRRDNKTRELTIRFDSRAQPAAPRPSGRTRPRPEPASQTPQDPPNPVQHVPIRTRPTAPRLQRDRTHQQLRTK